MENIPQIIASCEWSPVQALVISSNVFDPLIYYSHLFPLIISLTLGLFIFLKSYRQLISKVLFGTILLLAAWLFSDLILWATDKPQFTMFFWSMTILVEPMIYVGILYFMYLFIDRRDVSFGKKLIWAAMLVPTVAFASTKLALLGFDLSNCDRDAVEGILAYYGYFIEVAVIMWGLAFSVKRFIQLKDASERKKVLLVAIGSLGFLVAFAFGNVIGSLFDTYAIGGDYSWTIGQYGIFGIPVFTAFLAYLIVRYQSMNIKVIGTQVLVYGLTIIIGSELFFVTSTLNRVLVAITLAMSIAIGYFLVQSIKKEVEAKEGLSIANVRLKELDKQKSEFVSFATHQLRSPIASIKGNASIIIEGDTGKLPELAQGIVETIYTSAKTMSSVVEDYLNLSRIELGTMKYTLSDMDLGALAKEVMSEQKPNIEAKGLAWSLSVDESQTYKIKADPDKLKQVLMNTVDNSIKYTNAGSLSVSVTKDAARKVIVFKVVDTGVGIAKEVMPKLFQKFSRAPGANEANIHGTGLGLFIARDIMNAHGGKIWAESEGEGKGSQFYVEVPEAK